MDFSQKKEQDPGDKSQNSKSRVTVMLEEDNYSDWSLQTGGCVILAGINGIAARESQSILRDLEQRFLSQKSSDGVILATVLHRHDLPPLHPVDHKTRLFNSYMVDFSARNEGLHILNFNIISRRWSGQ
ncbi:hypothetical protein J6590_072279 [Homalodisca vitripennis]|nr:hypothetical protein J6590_072279 [Homalodisca vitripennis]